MHDISTVEHTGALTVYRASEVGSKKVIGMATKMLKFGSMLSSQEEDKYEQLNARFEEGLK